MKKKQYKWYPITGAILTALTLQTTASVLLDEAFDYPNGPIVGALDSPWEAHSGAGNGPILVTDGLLNLASDQAEDINAPLAGAPHAPDGAVPALYVGLTLRLTTLPTARGSYFVHLRNSTTSHRARVWINRSDSGPDQYRVGIGNSTGASATTGPWPADLELGDHYRLVFRYDLASGLSTIWIDPAVELDPGVTATDNPGPIEVSTVAFRQNGDIGRMEIDDLRVADTFAEVATLGVRLQLTRVGTELEVTWPGTAVGYVLEGASDLMEPLWEGVDGIPVLEEGQYFLRLPTTGAQRYFRLVKP